MKQIVAFLAAFVVAGWCVRVLVSYATHRPVSSIVGHTLMAFDTACCLLLLATAIMCIAMRGVYHD